MSMASRRKGKVGELELAAELTKLTGREWRRTAQRRGKGATSDVETDGVQLHVECKRWGSGLKTAYLRLADQRLAGHLPACSIEPAGWIVMQLADLLDPEGVQSLGMHVALRCVTDAVLQAERDAEGRAPAIVCMRADLGPWLVAVKYSQLVLVRAALRGVCPS